MSTGRLANWADREGAVPHSLVAGRSWGELGGTCLLGTCLALPISRVLSRVAQTVCRTLQNLQTCAAAVLQMQHFNLHRRSLSTPHHKSRLVCLMSSLMFALMRFAELTATPIDRSFLKFKHCPF